MKQIELRKGWMLCPDPENRGREEHWEKALPAGALPCEVPGRVHLTFPDARGIAWYQRRFDNIFPKEGRVILRIDTADYLSETFLNGHSVGTHRGVEDTFSYDITDFLCEGENLLAIRVAKPYSQDVDGYSFDHIPHFNSRKDDTILPGTCLNTFGLGGRVDLLHVPCAYIDELVINGNPETGMADLLLYVKNTGAPCRASLRLDIVDRAADFLSESHERELDLPAGESEHRLSVPVRDWKFWSPDEPNLYRLRAALQSDGEQILEKNFGFRTFRVNKDGFFELNGKRILMRCSHTGNFFPNGSSQTYESGLWRQDFAKAKACGFNTVRFIATGALPEQLDYCDEIGMMVYEESKASWLTINNCPLGSELYDEDMLSVVRRDRSHPCVTVFGTLNETHDNEIHGDCTRYASALLPRIRELDPTRLVIYSSGRFDGHARQGSYANPYSSEWECGWNAEDPVNGVVDCPPRPDLPPLYDKLGDVHLYPRVPFSDANVETIRTLGEETGRPVFFSEFGIGSAFNTTETLLRYKMRGADPRWEDYKVISRMDEMYHADFERYHLDEEYAFPVELLRESERLHNRHREFYFDIIRANPRTNGMSVTGLLDHSICGEGLWSITRQFKPGIADTIERGFSPLRWSIFVHHTHSYINRPFVIEGVLSNEDVLKAGVEYPVGVCIMGKDGPVWRKSYLLKPTADDLRGTALPVFKETLTLDVPEGEYQIQAEILDHATAADGVRTFWLSDGEVAQPEFKKVFVSHVDEGAARFLAERGVEVLPIEQAGDGALVLVGLVPEEERAAVWEKINALLGCGAKVFVTDRHTLKKDEDWGGYIPLPERPEVFPHTERSGDWLYHYEYIAKRHPYFRNLPCGKLMNWYYYGQLVGGACLSGGTQPESPAGVCIFPGQVYQPGYEGGVNLGTYPVGPGRLTLSTYRILEFVGQNPAADRLLVNVLNEESKK